MKHQPLGTTALVALMAVCGAAACDDGAGSTSDAGRDAAALIDGGGTDATSSTLSVDFTAAGCERLDGEPLRCTGVAPLSITFIPVITASVGQLLWTFGDGSAPTSDATPLHVFKFPGTYDVTLVGGGLAGTVSQARPGFIVVRANGVGAPCDVDAQCDTTLGLTCLCGSAAGGCSGLFARGVCSVPCRDVNCAAPAVCGDLSTVAGSGDTEAWRRPICLAPCESDSACPVGMRCRSLPGRYPTGQWIKACFIDEPSDLGASCRAVGGSLLDDRCITGMCADLGALGMCSLSCQRDPCPAGSGCAAFNSGEKLCVPLCTDTARCNQDPLLACEASGGTGPRSFVITSDGPTDARFCAPKTCTKDEECGLAGVCQPGMAATGTCTRR